MAKYTEAKDKAKDAKMIKNLTPKQKAAFKKMDGKHKKVKTMAQDRAIDKKLIAKAKKVK